jgi:hypothetical protein
MPFLSFFRIRRRESQRKMTPIHPYADAADDDSEFVWLPDYAKAAGIKLTDKKKELTAREVRNIRALRWAEQQRRLKNMEWHEGKVFTGEYIYRKRHGWGGELCT